MSDNHDDLVRGAVAIPRIAELPGPLGFPVAICRKDGRLPEPMPAEPTLFYCWVFDCYAKDYIPVAAHHSRAEAEQALAARKAAWLAAYPEGMVSPLAAPSLN